MTDYVISEEKLREIVPESVLKFDTGICAHPLSEEHGKFINERCRCKNIECIDYKKELCSPWKCNYYLKGHDAEIRNKVMDEFGILHGEDAKRLQEYMNDPNPTVTYVNKDAVNRAKELMSGSDEHDAELKCRTCGGIVTSPKCDRCYANNIANIKEEIAKKERERVLDIILHDIEGRSMIGRALEIVAEERGKNWLREQLITSLRGKP